MPAARQTSSLCGRTGFGTVLNSPDGSTRQTTLYRNLNLSLPLLNVRQVLGAALRFANMLIARQSQPTKELAPIVERKNVQDSQEDDEAMVAVKQRTEVQVKLWASLLHKRGFGVSVDGKLIRAAPTASQSRASPERSVSPVGGSVINKFRRDNAFAPEPVPARSQPFAARNKANDLPPPSLKKGLFSGLKFYLVGETKSAGVKSAIEDGGGQTVSNDEAAHFIVVRLFRYAS